MVELAAISAGIALLKDIHTGLSKLSEVKRNMELMDQIEAMQALRSTLIDAKEEISNLREHAHELEEEIKITRELVFDENIGIYKGNISGDKELAYCTKCWVEFKRPTPLKIRKDGYVCFTCRSYYPDPNYKPDNQRAARRMNPYTKRYEPW